MNSRTLVVTLLLVCVFSLAACSADVNGVPEPRPVADSNAANGQRLLASYGCGSCHSIPGVPGANGYAGPPLGLFYERSYIAGMLPNTTDNLVKWIQDPQQVVPGNAMPNLGVKPEEARDMAAYLDRQSTILDWFSR